MTGLAMAQRRKAATYGKPSRKAIVATGNAFAQIAATDIWDTEAKFSDDKQRGARIGLKSALDQASVAGIQSSGRSAARSSPKTQNHKQRQSPIRQNRATSTPSGTTNNDMVFDVPSSEDEQELKVSSSRKRRKITPTMVVDDVPYVYDDASLQRHVAAEASSEARDVKRRSPSGIQEKAERVRRVHNPPHGGGERDSKANHRAHSIRYAGSPAAGLKSTKASPQKTQKAKEKPLSKVIRPATPEVEYNAAGLHRSGGTRAGSLPSVREAYRPTTPLRSPKPPEGATTPRQRELWSRLLTDDAQNASPSNLDLPGLILTVRKHKKSESLVTARKVTWGKAQDTASKSRPRRLVDTLKSVDNGPRSRDGNDSDDESKSDSRKNQSNSLQSETSAVDGAVTVQTSPSADSQTRPQQPQDPVSAHLSQSLPSLHGVGLKVTYARQRSYLTEDDLNEVAMLSVPANPEPMNTISARRRGLGDRIPKSQSTQIYDEDFGDIQDSQSGAMRSVHELREAGGNVRLVSELEALLDDIDDKQPVSATLPRTKLINLVSKLQEPSNCRIFIDHGFESRLLAHIGFDDDLITDSLFAAAILQLLTGPSSTPLLAQISDVRVVGFFIGLLGFDQDLRSSARLRQYNISKVAQLEYRNLCDSLLKSAGWRAGKPPCLSCHVLALQCLEYIVRQTREAGSLSEVLSAHAISRIVATSIPDFSTPPPSPTALSSVDLELAVSILESCTIGNTAECQEPLWAGEILERVIGLLPLLASWKQEQYSMSQTLTLRLYLNITNNNPGLSEDFSTPDIVNVLFNMIVSNFGQLTDTTRDRILVLDHLILSLGSFINLADSSEVVRSLVWKLHNEGQSHLDVLLELYITRSKRASEVGSWVALPRSMILIS